MAKKTVKLALPPAAALPDPDWFGGDFSPALKRVRDQLAIVKLQKERMVRAMGDLDPMLPMDIPEIVGKLLLGARPEMIAADLGLPVEVVQGIAIVLPFKAIDLEAMRRVKRRLDDAVEQRALEHMADREDAKQVGRGLLDITKQKVVEMQTAIVAAQRDGATAPAATHASTEELKELSNIAKTSLGVVKEAWRSIDDKLDGGAAATSINIFAAPAKSPFDAAKKVN